MLVLSRKKGESLVIQVTRPVEITVAVVEMKGDRVRIGVDAPHDVVINRQEVHDAIAREMEREGRA
jgi:carbon storage regulator